MRVESKKDSREIQISSASALRGSSSSVDDKNIFPVTVSRVSADILKVSPTLPLRLGEYLLNASADRFFDFGISGDQKDQKQK